MLSDFSAKKRMVTRKLMSLILREKMIIEMLGADTRIFEEDSMNLVGL